MSLCKWGGPSGLFILQKARLHWEEGEGGKGPAIKEKKILFICCPGKQEYILLKITYRNIHIQCTHYIFVSARFTSLLKHFPRNIAH